MAKVSANDTTKLPSSTHTGVSAMYRKPDTGRVGIMSGGSSVLIPVS